MCSDKAGRLDGLADPSLPADPEGRIFLSRLAVPAGQRPAESDKGLLISSGPACSLVSPIFGPLASIASHITRPFQVTSHPPATSPVFSTCDACLFSSCDSYDKPKLLTTVGKLLHHGPQDRQHRFPQHLEKCRFSGPSQPSELDPELSRSPE